MSADHKAQGRRRALIAGVIVAAVIAVGGCWCGSASRSRCPRTTSPSPSPPTSSRIGPARHADRRRQGTSAALPGRLRP